MKKAIFILPYFGKFPNYFQLFLNSCEKNEDYNWLIFTDDKTKYSYPRNVKVNYITFEEIKNIIQSKFDFKLAIDFPKKLCDYKPLYGFIFSSYIKDYDYWGYCDCDLIFGKINNFIDFKKLSNYDKIGIVGHLTLMKNKKEVNEFFKNDNNFKKIFSNSKNFVYDEGFDDSVNNILQKMNKKIYNIEEIADISVNNSSFVLTNYDFKINNYVSEKKVKSFFTWEDGKVIRYILKDKNWIKKEYIYIHLQKRNMKVNNKNNNIYKIVPNVFEDIEKDFYENKYSKIKINHITFHKIKFLYGKVKNKLFHRWK